MGMELFCRNGIPSLKFLDQHEHDGTRPEDGTDDVRLRQWYLSLQCYPQLEKNSFFAEQLVEH